MLFSFDGSCYEERARRTVRLDRKRERNEKFGDSPPSSLITAHIDGTTYEH